MASLMGLDLSRDSTGGGDPNFKLDVGSVLARTFGIWGRNLVSFTVVGLVVEAPVLLGLAAVAVSGLSKPAAITFLDAVSNLLTLVLTGGVTYGVFQELRGQRAGVGDVLRTGLSRLVAVFITGLLVGIATALGFCVLIVPGLILLVRYWLAVPVTVIERPGIMASMGRSQDLTEGNRWAIFGLALLMALVVGVPTVALGGILAAVQGGLEASSPAARAWSQLALEALIIPLQALAAVAPSVVYHDLRVGKEGADLEDLLRAFD
jgi:hypothetical protein